MTIQAAVSEQPYLADGVSVVFAIPFPFDTAADIKITSTDSAGNILTLSTGFTISGGAGLMGNATFSVAPASGLTITIYDDPARTQPTDYVSLDAFPAESHERALDRVTRIAKRLYQLVQRSVRFPDGDVSTDGVLGSVANRKGKYLFFNAVTGAIEYAANIVTTTLSQSVIAQLLNPQSNAEVAAGVVPTNYAYPIGYLGRYFTNTVPGTTDATAAFTKAIAQAQQTGGAPIIVHELVAIASNVTLPKATAGNLQPTLIVLSNASINIASGKMLTLSGLFYAPRSTAFTGAGTVVLGDGCCEEVFPEWWGARNDSNNIATTGTDSTAAINACFTACAALNAGAVSAAVSVRFDAGFYRCGTINSICPSMVIRGKGRWTTSIFCNPGTTGAWWQENANGAAKVIIEDLALYGNNIAVLTYGLRLGYVNAASPHGTEGYVRGLLVRDVPAGTGVAISGNVGFYDLISVYNCQSHIAITGTGNMASKIAVIGTGSSPGTMVTLNQCTVYGLEIEAPATGSLPLLIQAPCSIDGLWLSGADGTTIDHWIEFGASATSWAIKGLIYYFGAASTTTVTSGNMKRADGTFFGGNATGSGAGGTAAHTGEGNFFSENQGLRQQCFTLRITNVAGTLKHHISDPTASANNFQGLINGATAVDTTTPTAADASTAFAAGGKIGGTNTNSFIFDVPNQAVADTSALAVISANSSATALTCVAENASININGVTRIRLQLFFYDAAAGTNFALTTANIAAGKFVQVTFLGGLSP